MIYAIHAVGTPFIKFGRATSVGKRLKELETGSPHDLYIVAVADWPDGAEAAVHKYLEPQAERREWFRDGERTQQLINWMLSGALEHLQAAITQEVESRVATQLHQRIARFKRVREIKKEKVAQPLSTRTRASNLPTWELAVNPIARRRAEREAFWRTHGVQEIAGKPLDVVRRPSPSGISQANESLDGADTRVLR